MRILAFAGGRLGPWATTLIREDDILVGIDKGAFFLVEHGFKPDLAIGDFDSVTPLEKSKIQSMANRFIDCDPVYKDLTDTEMAMTWAIEQQPEDLFLLGASGTRLDHTLANIQVLIKPLRAGVQCKLIDEHNTVQLIDRELRLEASDYTNVSLLPLTPFVKGITLRGFRYPLQDAVLEVGQSLGISNVLVEPSGHIQIKEGLLLVIQSKD